MAFYSKTNEVFDGNGFTYFDEGTYSTIYRLDDVLFKEYDIDCHIRFRLQKKMFILLKELNIPNLVKLHDYYYMYTSTIMRLLSIDGYTMELVKGEKIKLIDCEKKFLIYILKELENTLNILSENKIVLYDVHPKNIVITNNGITIIDPDQFYTLPLCSKNKVYMLNKIELLKCINDILRQEFKDVVGYKIDSFITNNDHSLLMSDVENSLSENTFYHSIISKKK